MTAPQDLTSHYRLEQVLSWTGVARTFRGIDPDSGGPVAVKLLTLGATHRAADAQRFESGVGILRSLQHPVLPEILAGGVAPSGDAYLVTRWIEGQSLAEGGTHSVETVLSAMLRITEGLESLALHGLVHLNLIPENVLMGDDGAKLIGWGTSLVSIDRQATPKSSAEGPVHSFSAPELLQPRTAGEALWRADLYSIALMTARLLGAQVAAPGSPSPAVRFSRDLSDQLGRAEELRGVLQRCLARDPEQRPGAFSELTRALQHAFPRTARAVSDTQPVAVVDPQASQEDATVMMDAGAAQAAAAEHARSLGLDPEAPQAPASDATVIMSTQPAAAPSDVPTDSTVAMPTAGDATLQGSPPPAVDATQQINLGGPAPPVDATVQIKTAPPASNPAETLPQPAAPPPAPPKPEKPASPPPAPAEKPPEPVVAKPPAVPPPVQEAPPKPAEKAAAKAPPKPEPESSADKPPPKKAPAEKKAAAEKKPAAPKSAAKAPEKPAGKAAEKASPAKAPPAKADKPKAETQRAQTQQADTPQPEAAPAAPPQTSSGPKIPLWAVAIGALAIVGLLAIVFLALLLRGRGEEEPEAPVVTEAPVAPSEPIEAVEEVEPEVELPAELLEAMELVASGDLLDARRALEALSEQESEGLLAPEVCAAFHSLEETVVIQRRDSIRAALARSLQRGEASSLRRVLRAMNGSEEAAVRLLPEGPGLISRSRVLVAAQRSFDQALEDGDAQSALASGLELRSSEPEIEARLGWVDRALGILDSRVDVLISAGRLEEAEAVLADIESAQPGRSGIADRRERIVRERASDRRYDTLLASAREAGVAGRPHEGIEMIRGVQVPADRQGEFQGLLGELEKNFTEMDSDAPTLAVSSETEYRRRSPVEMEIRASDDYEVMSVTLFVRQARRADFTEIEAVKSESGSYTAVIDVAVHENRNLVYYVEAVDRSGHTGSLGSRQQPIELKRDRWFN
ncbi:MAG: protein kinase [Acidobacteriota bacterium]